MTSSWITTLSCLAALAIPSALATAETACQSLKEALPNDDVVALPGSQAYTTVTTNAWNAANEQQRPACAVFPSNAGDVQTAMKIIFDADVNYAVRAGGHSGMVGWNK